MRCIIDTETLTDFHYIINSARRSLGLVLTTPVPTPLPYQPLLISIANSVKTGCNYYYRLLRKKSNLEANMSTRENKWHQELGIIISKQFWSKTYMLTAEISYDNKMKWLQFQLVRNSLYTNYKVNKFNSHMSPFCTFCLQRSQNSKNLELVSHVFKECSIVHVLWTGVQSWLNSLGINLPLDTKSLLFGVHEQPATSVVNYVILTVKYYIWVSRLRNQSLFYDAYQGFLFKRLEDLRNAYIYSKKDHNFDPYIVLFNSLHAMLQDA